MVEKKPGEAGHAMAVQTDGINFEGAWANADVVDTAAVTSNDVGSMLRTFGVEAARATVVAEVSAVFGAYGIGVNPRHLSLISDHMTHQVRALGSCCMWPLAPVRLALLRCAFLVHQGIESFLPF